MGRRKKDRPSAEELRERLDRDLIDYLEEEYGDEAFSREGAVDAYLVEKGHGATGTVLLEQMWRVVMGSLQRIRHQPVRGFPRYLWNGEGDCLQVPHAIPEEALARLAAQFVAMAGGQVRLAGVYQSQTASRGLEVDKTDLAALEALVATLQE